MRGAVPAGRHQQQRRRQGRRQIARHSAAGQLLAPGERCKGRGQVPPPAAAAGGVPPTCHITNAQLGASWQRLWRALHAAVHRRAGFVLSTNVPAVMGAWADGWIPNLDTPGWNGQAPDNKAIQHTLHFWMSPEAAATVPPPPLWPSPIWLGSVLPVVAQVDEGQQRQLSACRGQERGPEQGQGAVFAEACRGLQRPCRQCRHPAVPQTQPRCWVASGQSDSWPKSEPPTALLPSSRT
jgi:hypothetical protein